ncbi:hypothetical protein AB1Y20_000367 [Prymnesium parvum]|uniref:Autophagy protein 5 n=1 Tax=Prymnesium parvum TaxID=97485 RepID=A0AB34K830_PRYPA
MAAAFHFAAAQLDLQTTRVRISREGASQPLMWSDVIQLWSTDEPFQHSFSSALAEAKFAQFFFECPPLNAALAPTTPFEYVLKEAPPFRAADPSAFSKHFASATGAVATFPNLGADATLIAPCPAPSPPQTYASLASFVRAASDSQLSALWSALGRAMSAALLREPTSFIWVNTEGSGVPWLHVRLDSQPKYYHHLPYRNTAAA